MYVAYKNGHVLPLLCRVALISFLPACFASESCGRTPLRQRCHYASERVLFEGGGTYIRSVSLSRGPRNILAGWTDAEGVRVQPLSRDGEPLGRPVRVASPAESIDVAPQGEGFVIAALLPGDLFAGGGTALLRTVDERGSPTSPPVMLGRAGTYSKGIAVAPGPAGPMVLWNDGVPGDPSVKQHVSGLSAPRRLSSRRRNGCCPHVVATEQGYLAAWGEYLVTDPSGWVMAQRFDSEGSPLSDPVVITRTRTREAWPSLEPTPDGFALMYRDRLEDSTLDGLFFMRFGEGDERVVGPIHLGRYDGPTRGVLLSTSEVFVTVAVRSWARERILGIDRFDWLGNRIGAEMHVYFDYLRLTDADAIRDGTRYILVFSEDNPNQKVWWATVQCQ